MHDKYQNYQVKVTCYLLKESLCPAQYVFELLQFQNACHESFIICIAVFHFTFKLLKLSLKDKTKMEHEMIITRLRTLCIVSHY